MKRGPAPTPSSTKRLRGTYRPDRASGEPAAEPGLPRAPDFLGPDAKREWARIVPLLYERGLLEKIDRASLVSYVVSWGDLAESTRILSEEGTTCITARGGLTAHPELRRSDKARAHLRGFAQEFGLSPSARTRVKSSPPPTPQDSERAARALRFFGSPDERASLKREFAP